MSWFFIPFIPLVPRIEYRFNKTFGVQADIGLLGFMGIDITANVKSFGEILDGYIFAGAMTISPLIYLLNTQVPDGPTFSVEVGAGLRLNLDHKKFSLGLEGGFEIPIPPVPDTGAFRIDLYSMWNLPIKNK